MIALEHITKTFERRPVLDDLSLEIARGDRIALIGSNGAGKTTLFRCLLGHYRHQGQVRFEGAGQGRSAGVLAKIAFVPQLPPPLRMPVGELLSFAERGAGASREEMVAISTKLGIDLAEVRNRPFWRLSGGQKQKILVTLALGRAAEMFIFDEPAANLDPAARAVFIDLLAERRDASMLIASHRLEEVAPLVNRVVELDRGRVVLDDRLRDALAKGETRTVTLRLIEPHPTLEQALRDWGLAPQGALWSGRIAGAETFRFLALLARYGSKVEAITVEGAAHV